MIEPTQWRMPPGTLPVELMLNFKRLSHVMAGATDEEFLASLDLSRPCYLNGTLWAIGERLPWMRPYLWKLTPVEAPTYNPKGDPSSGQGIQGREG